MLKDARETPDTLDALIEYPGFTLQASFYHTNARPIEGRDYGIAFYGTQATMLLTREGFEVWPEGDHTQPIRSEGSALDGPFQRQFLECMRSRRKPFADVETGHRFNHSCVTPPFAQLQQASDILLKSHLFDLQRFGKGVAFVQPVSRERGEFDRHLS